MKELWLSADEFAKRMGWTARHLNRKREELDHRETSRRTKNGKPTFEYSSANLPPEVRLSLASHALTVPAEENLTPIAGALREIHRQCHFTPRQDQELAEVLELIAPLRDFDEGREVFLEGGRKAQTKKEIVKWIAANHVGWLGGKSKDGKPPSDATIRRYWGDFKKGNLLALVRPVHSHKGKSRVFASHPAASAFVQQKYLNEGLSFQMSWEALCRDWQKVDGAGDPPSYSATRQFLRMIPKPARVLAREGKQAYESKCSLSVRRAPQMPMEWWISDHRQFDVMVRNTLFAELKPNEPYRVWFTAILDWGSRKIVGWCFAPTPSSRTINSALRLAALTYGFPRNFYWDNGEDYKKVRRDLEKLTLSVEVGAVLGREGVNLGITSALPFHPRSKPIEAHFTHWSKRFDVIWRPAYLGNRPGNRPEIARHSEALHQKFLNGKRASTPLPTDAEFILGATQAIEDYNEKAHKSLQHRTPNEVMEEQYPERTRPKVNPRLLDLLFWEKTKRVVQAGGCVQLDGLRYEPEDSSLAALDMRQGQRVVILRDPYNLGEAVAADADTMQFVGELHIQELIAQAPNGRITRDQIKAAMRKQRAMTRGYSEYLAALSVLAVNSDWKTEREDLVFRATGTYGITAPVSSAPGAAEQKCLPPARAMRNVQPAIVSDAVKQDAEIFREIKLED